MSDLFLEHGLPQEVAAEKSFLGSILLNPSIIDQASSLLNPDDLFLDSHKRLFRAQLYLASTGLPIDLVTLESELRKRSEFEQIGGATYIGSLVDYATLNDNLGPYASLIKEASLKRQLIRSCAEATALCYDGEESFADIIQRVEEAVFALADARREHEGARPVAVIAGPLIDYYEQKSLDPGKLIGLSTGYTDLDERTQGLTEGLTLIAARPSFGKTALAVNIACNVAIRGGGSVYFASLESGAEKIVQRVLASEARIDSIRMRSGFMNGQEWPRLHNALQSLAVTRFVVDDDPYLSPAELASRCRQYQAKNGLDLLVVDYVQLMARRLMLVRRFKDLRFAVQEVGAELVALSRQLHIPILGVAQLSRDPDKRTDHRPTVADLGESASLEQDADLVLFLLREEQYQRTDANRGLATVIFGKQRDGGTDQDITMAFLKEYTRFESLDRNLWPVPPPTRAERREAARSRRDYMERNDPDDD